MQPVGVVPVNPLNGTPDNLNGFSANYPYDVNSVYYANNHLLYNLYLERTQRQQQLEDETRYASPYFLSLLPFTVGI